MKNLFYLPYIILHFALSFQLQASPSLNQKVRTTYMDKPPIIPRVHMLSLSKYLVTSALKNNLTGSSTGLIIRTYLKWKDWNIKYKVLRLFTEASTSK